MKRNAEETEAQAHVTAPTEPAGMAAGEEPQSKRSRQEQPARRQPAKQKRNQFVFGNYDEYYGYRHSAQAPQEMDPRLVLIRRSISLAGISLAGKSILDIGCNSGAITFSAAEHFSPRSVLGIDIDGHLIERAARRLATIKAEQAATNVSESKPAAFPHNLTFRAQNFVAKRHVRKKEARAKKEAKQSAKTAAKACLDSATEEEDEASAIAAVQAGPPAGATAAAVPSSFGRLDKHRERFDVIFCFSVTKWVHLNWGDKGLHTLFRRVYETLPDDGTGLFVLEPQPWKSYVIPPQAPNVSPVRERRQAGAGTSRQATLPWVNH
jgi:7SK snRNA methylphosphate capping enzyme